VLVLGVTPPTGDADTPEAGCGPVVRPLSCRVTV